MSRDDYQVVAEVISKISEDTKKPEVFLSIQNALATSQIRSTKELYDFGRSLSATRESCVLPELILDGFDDEQVWQEIEIGCNNSAARIQTGIERMASVVASISFNLRTMESTDAVENSSKTTKTSDEKSSGLKKSSTSDNDEIDTSDNEDNSSVDSFDKNSDLSSDQNSDQDLGKSSSDNDETVQKTATNKKAAKLKNKIGDVQGNKSVAESNKRSKTGRRSIVKGSVVDDKFFKLSEMEAFADEQDRIELRRTEVGGDEEEDNEMDILSDEDSGNEIMAKDFFDSPDDEANLSNEEEDEEEEEEEDEDEKSFWSSQSKNKDENKSSYEKRLEKIQSKVHELEEQNLSEKPWQLRGEVLANSRPMNSLLAELVDFEHAARQPPLITEETTKTEESFIIQRIKDRAWDDVIRKVKPVNDGRDYRKRVVLDQEKSKIGLADQYALDFQKEAAKLSQDEVKEKEDPKHANIRKNLEKLFIKLDALSNFHFTPKPIVRDIEIITNEPSIVVEEVAPTCLSTADLLAPEQIQAKTKGELLGSTERTTTDKKRERRKKKIIQHVRQQAEEEKKKKLKMAGVVDTKENAMKDLVKKSKSDKGITIIKEKTKTRNNNKKRSLSSNQFFSQLQSDATSQIKRKKLELQKPSDSNKNSTKRLKL